MEEFMSESKRKALAALGKRSFLWIPCNEKPEYGKDVLITDGERYSIAYWSKSNEWSLQASNYFEPTYWTLLPKLNIT